MTLYERATEEDRQRLEKLRGHFRRLEDDNALEEIILLREARDRWIDRTTLARIKIHNLTHAATELLPLSERDDVRDEWAEEFDALRSAIAAPVEAP